MKKTLFPIVLVSVLLTIFSCDKSFDVKEDGLLVDESKSMTFTATIESDDDDTKTTLTNDLKVNWVQGDEISINGVIYVATPDEIDPTKATFDKKNQKDPDAQKDDQGNYIAYYPASLYDATSKKAILPSTQAHGNFALNPMYASSSTTSLSFKNICSVLKITSTGSLLAGSTISLSADKPLNGAFTVFNNKAEINESTISDENYKITLTGCQGQGPFYIAIPAQEYTTFKVQDNSGQKIKTMFKTFSTAKNLERSKIYTLSYTGDIALPGVFTVADSKTVRFSPGNLYCKRTSTTSSDWSWHFYDAQYKYNSLSASKTRTATDDDLEIDLFTWGCGDWSTKPVTTDYLGGDVPLVLSGDTDWGSKMGDTWRTLSIEDFVAILNGDCTIYGVTVCQKTNCLVIAPDGKTKEQILKSYDASTWITAEANGFVCLPAAGLRDGSSISNVGLYGYCWSSTAWGPITSSYLVFCKDDVFKKPDVRKFGLSVRLVTEN